MFKGQNILINSIGQGARFCFPMWQIELKKGFTEKGKFQLKQELKLGLTAFQIC